MSKFRNASVPAIVVSLCLSACAVGPTYTKPSTPAPPAYKETPSGGDWRAAQPADGLPRGLWWERYHDPQLNQLEQKLAISNQNIAAAAAGVEQARALIRQSRAQYFPSVTANPSLTNSRLSTAFGQTVGIGYTSYTLPFQASWEPDLFGRVRNTMKANTAAAQASAADLENVRLSAQSDLATDYFELRAQDILVRLLDSTVQRYREALELTSSLYRSGLDNDESVAQAEAQLEAARAQAMNAGVLRAQYEHAIAVLAGEPAPSLSIPVDASLPDPPAIPPGVPSQLLERRPDIAAAERAVAQANAQIGIARTAYFPTVTLSASAGFEALGITSWLTWPSRVWAVGPGLAETLFDAGLRRATVLQYQAAYDQTVASYRQTVLTAFQQVEDNLAALRVLAGVIERQNAAIEAAARSLEEAQARYKAGLDPYLNVITAETVLLADQQAAVSFRAQQMTASVGLIKALGGGWDVSRLPTPQQLGATRSAGR